MTDQPTDTDEQSQRTAAWMMYGAGLKPADIARALRVHEQQVRQWLQQPVPDQRREDER